MVLRYYYNGAIDESFLDFQIASQLDAAGLSQKIIQCLEKYGFYVHQKWLSVQEDVYQDAPRERQGLSDTGWGCRYRACKNLMDRLPAVLHVLHVIDVENSGERSVETQDLLTQIDLTFIGTQAVFRKVLGDTKLLSDMLQAPSLDLARAVNLIQALQDTLEEYRGESCFDELGQDTVDTAKQFNIAVEAVKKRLQRGNFRLSGYIVESTIGQHRCK